MTSIDGQTLVTIFMGLIIPLLSFAPLSTETVAAMSKNDGRKQKENDIRKRNEWKNIKRKINMLLSNIRQPLIYRVLT